jgi:hypothetical protein
MGKVSGHDDLVSIVVSDPHSPVQVDDVSHGLIIAHSSVNLWDASHHLDSLRNATCDSGMLTTIEHVEPTRT